MPAAQNTWMIIPLGIATFVTFYVVFRFLITRFDLKTPDREDDEPAQATGAKSSDDRFATIAAGVLEAVGGRENLVSIDNCVTRLRLEVRDLSLVDDAACKAAGAKGVMRPGKNSVQVVIGTQVQFVADEFKRLAR